MNRVGILNYLIRKISSLTSIDVFDFEKKYLDSNINNVVIENMEIKNSPGRYTIFFNKKTNIMMTNIFSALEIKIIRAENVVLENVISDATNSLFAPIKIEEAKNIKIFNSSASYVDSGHIEYIEVNTNKFELGNSSNYVDTVVLSGNISAVDLNASHCALKNTNIFADEANFSRCYFENCNIKSKAAKYSYCVFNKSNFNAEYDLEDNFFREHSFSNSNIYCSPNNFVKLLKHCFWNGSGIDGINPEKIWSNDHMNYGSNKVFIRKKLMTFSNPFRHFVYKDLYESYYIYTGDSPDDVVNLNNEFADINRNNLIIANPNDYPKELWILLQDYKLITYNSLIWEEQ